jgi:hypothetical protein
MNACGGLVGRISGLVTVSCGRVLAAQCSARVIGTDALRILLVSPEPSDGQEHKQDTKDDPNINAHQSSPAAGSYPRKARIA